jgi:glutamine synthetase
VARDKKGYAEDRRPNANMDPYVVTRLLLETVCSQEKVPAAGGKKKSKSRK